MTLLVQILSYKITLVLIISLTVFPLSLILGGMKRRLSVSFLGTILFVLAMLNVFFGSLITNPIIYEEGETGTAIVTDIEGLNETYNDRQVMLYKVLLKTHGGQTIETAFKSSDFNIYPRPQGGFSYPEVGIEFKVKYLPKDPRQFIILSNAESTYTQALKCTELLNQTNEAQQKVNFDPENKNFKEALEALSKAYLEMDCGKKLTPNNSSFEIHLDPIEINKTMTVEMKQ